jgi:ornithine cyclodeaminase/alanine dehydrogenase-like protein (mu-crystallin family)
MRTITMDAADVRAATSMSEAIQSVRQAFVDLAAGHFEQPTRTAMRDGQFLVMSTHHRPTATAMVKTLSLNFQRQPAIIGSVTWAEVGGSDQLIADATAVTALRTGAISGVATDLLAPAAASRMTIIGAGGQAADQVRGVHAVRPLRRLVVVDLDKDRAAALVDTLGPELSGVEVLVGGALAEAVADADIVTCATPSTEPLVASSMLQRRVHVNAIGGFRPTMRELPDELLAEATVVIDDLPAILEESGEILHALSSGAITTGHLTELGHALAEPPVMRDRTVFKTVGVAVQDWAIARSLAAKVLA